MKIQNKIFSVIAVGVMLCGAPIHAQIVPFYPDEIFFNPAGVTNSLPGCPATQYETFSSVKIVLAKDIPASQRWSHTFTFIGTVERFHSINKSRSYFPLSINPIFRTHFFATDIYSLCMELNGNYENLPGVTKAGMIYNSRNLRFRVSPFFYVIMTPNLIFNPMYTQGISRIYGYDADAVQERGDYDIRKLETQFIYFSNFHTRFFFTPYAFQDKYFHVRARDPDGTKRPNNPQLEEMGAGFAVGARYSTFTWGYSEGVFECERNLDRVYQANDYWKFKVNTKWENQYFTKYFGYMFMFDYIRHVSRKDLIIVSFKTQDGSTVTNSFLGRHEVRGDMMLIFNINRNVSFRPEFDFVYQALNDQNAFKKQRYWMHLHILL